MNDIDKITDLEAPLLSNDIGCTKEESTISQFEINDEELLTPTASTNGTPTTNEVYLQSPTAEVMDISDADSVNTLHTTTAMRGQWRDGLCACCSQGCCHPSLLCSCFFPSIAIAQVMVRLNLLLSGKQGSQRLAKYCFFLILAINILFYAINAMFLDVTVMGVMSSIFALFIMYLIYITRSFIRKRYQISENCCVGCEDLCMTIFFPCCTISQMARHTVDYDTYRATMFSTTGLPGSVPIAVV